MFHAFELALILLLLAIAQSVIDIAPHAGRRAVLNFIAWVATFAVGIWLLFSQRLAATAVRLGILALAAYTVRWIFEELEQWLRGPFFFPQPKANVLAQLASEIGDLRPRESRRLARRILREHEGNFALLGLITMRHKANGNAPISESGWMDACQKAQHRVIELAQRYCASRGSVTPKVADVLFVAQGLCLYEADSVERVLARLPAPALGSRTARLRAASQLAQHARRRPEAEQLGLVAPQVQVSHADHESGPSLLTAAVCPPLSLLRAGFPHRAAALAISMGLLWVYGVLAFIIGRDSAWVFLCVALLVHIQSALAVSDFICVAAHQRSASTAGGE